MLPPILERCPDSPISLSRILRMLQHEDPTTGAFALAKAPTSAKFGKKRLAHFVCLADSDVVMKVWIIGRVEFLYFRDTSKSVSLTVAPLVPADLEAANAMLRRYSSPVPRESVV